MRICREIYALCPLSCNHDNADIDQVYICTPDHFPTTSALALLVSILNFVLLKAHRRLHRSGTVEISSCETVLQSLSHPTTFLRIMYVSLQNSRSEATSTLYVNVFGLHLVPPLAVE